MSRDFELDRNVSCEELTVSPALGYCLFLYYFLLVYRSQSFLKQRVEICNSCDRITQHNTFWTLQKPCGGTARRSVSVAILLSELRQYDGFVTMVVYGNGTTSGISKGLTDLEGHSRS